MQKVRDHTIIHLKIVTRLLFDPGRKYTAMPIPVLVEKMFYGYIQCSVSHVRPGASKSGIIVYEAINVPTYRIKLARCCPAACCVRRSARPWRGCLFITEFTYSYLGIQLLVVQGGVGKTSVKKIALICRFRFQFIFLRLMGRMSCDSQHCPSGVETLFLRQIPHCNVSAPAALYRLVPSTGFVFL